MNDDIHIPAYLSCVWQDNDVTYFIWLLKRVIGLVNVLCLDEFLVNPK